MMFTIGSILFLWYATNVYGLDCHYKNNYGKTPAKTDILSFGERIVPGNSCLLMTRVLKKFTDAKFWCESEFIDGKLMSNKANVKYLENYWRNSKSIKKDQSYWVGESLGKCLNLRKWDDSLQCTERETVRLSYFCEYPPQDYCAWQLRLYGTVINKDGTKCLGKYFYTWQWNDFRDEKCDTKTSATPDIVDLDVGSKKLCDCYKTQRSDWTSWSSCEPCNTVASQNRTLKFPGCTAENISEWKSCKVLCTTTTPAATSTTTTTTPTTTTTILTTTMTTPTSTTATRTLTNTTKTKTSTALKASTTIMTTTTTKGINDTDTGSSGLPSGNTSTIISVSTSYATSKPVTTGTTKRRNESEAFTHVFVGFVVIGLIFVIIGSICLIVENKKKQTGPLGLMSTAKTTSSTKRKSNIEISKSESAKSKNSSKSASNKSKNLSKSR